MVIVLNPTLGRIDSRHLKLINKMEKKLQIFEEDYLQVIY